MCIIASVPGPNGPILLKNRDRNYEVNLKLTHTHGAVVLLDTLTYWLEGCNEQGVCIVNSALMVGRDEKEKKKSKGGSKSRDGVRILRALMCDTIEACLESLLSYNKGIKGHTFIATKDRLWCLETTSKHTPVLTELDPNVLHVRTNHGVYHRGAGYQEGEDRLSSQMRLATSKIVLQNCTTPEEVLFAVNRRFLEKDSPYNMVRATEKMRTSSQLVMEPGTRKIYVNLIDEFVEDYQDNYRDEGTYKVTLLTDLKATQP